ncbi:hypothetical protein ACW0US_17595 [Xanthomonas euvesicatoria]
MTLPIDFLWKHSHLTASGPPTALVHLDVWVARLDTTIDGVWFANLYAYRCQDEVLRRRCRSYESGRAGIEEWASRRHARIRSEVAHVIEIRDRLRSEEYAKDRVLKRRLKSRKSW